MKTFQSETLYVKAPGELAWKSQPVVWAELLETIVVKTRYCGICASDHEAIEGKGPALGPTMSGHEGLGEVVVSAHPEFRVGSFVTTWWHPAFSDYYETPVSCAARVQSLEPQYIAQPLACVLEAFQMIRPPVLVYGTGYLATLLAQVCRLTSTECVFVTERPAGDPTLHPIYGSKIPLLRPGFVVGEFKTVVDVSGNYSKILSDHLELGGRYIFLAHPHLDTVLWDLSWKNATVHFPSPRSPSFQRSFVCATALLQVNAISHEGMLKVWHKDRAVEAFADRRGAMKHVLEWPGR